MRTLLTFGFYKSRNPKVGDVLMITLMQQSTLTLLRWGKKRIKTYGKISVVYMLNEYKQLRNLDVFGPQDSANMSHQDMYRAFRAIHIIKKK